MSTKTISTIMGDSIEVDISDEACGEFGFKHGDRVVAKMCYGALYSGVIQGVAYDDDLKTKLLWCTFDRRNGKASYVHPFHRENWSLEV